MGERQSEPLGIFSTSTETYSISISSSHLAVINTTHSPFFYHSLPSPHTSIPLWPTCTLSLSPLHRRSLVDPLACPHHSNTVTHNADTPYSRHRMDRNTVHLYEALEVPKTATQDEIKRSYRYTWQTVGVLSHCHRTPYHSMTREAIQGRGKRKPSPFLF